MNRSDLWKWSAGYALGWIVSTAVGLGIAAAGAILWALPAYYSHLGGTPATAALRSAAPGIVLILLGAFVWRAGSTAARYRTLTAAFATETAEHLDTEALKSDVLSVLDERLADMKQDTQATRRVVERLGSEEAAQSFEFGEEP